MEQTALANMIEQFYGAEVFSCQVLSERESITTCRIAHAGGPDWVARFAREDNGSGERLSSMAPLLVWLEGQQYPAERIVRSVGGRSSILEDGVMLIVTESVTGTALDYSPPTLRELGATLGRLHTLPLPEQLPLAAMRPATEIPWVSAQLATVATLTPPALQSRYDFLTQALHTLDPLDDLPQVILHNDCHPANAVRLSDGRMTLIDWVGAGRGAAIIDLGFLLASTVSVAPWTEPIAPNPERALAVAEGYARLRRLTPDELARLPDAIRFRSLVYGAAQLTDLIADGQTEEPLQGWWARYRMANEIARNVRQALSMPN
ncbi:MAG TPA: phosphotransferase [Ktedonobacterales bacterium]|nr:phosphotransferase [Ktedonobacterales bacterium]